jgi:lysyl-tRNA synthetase class 2
MLRRGQGKVNFLQIRDWTGAIQVFVGKNQIGEAGWSLASLLDLGDLLGVDGTLGYTKTGELTVFASGLTFLGKSLLPPPEKWHGLTDVELRSRQRDVDLFSNPESLATFLGRSKIIAAFRNVLAGRGFMEVETPTMQSIAGGAAARPFTTHHNTLDLDLYLRIAPELYLKRLLVGGMERVFEIGRVYRNEGISPKHNPEFTMMEAYQAYGDYHSMMDLTEALIAGAIEALDGTYRRPWGETTIDFSPPWPRRTYAELFHEHTGVDMRGRYGRCRGGRVQGRVDRYRHGRQGPRRPCQ